MSDIRIRQICLIAADLDAAQRQLESVFRIEVAYRDPGVAYYGLRNMLMPIGNQLLETASPEADEPDTAGGRYLKRRGGDGGYMVIMQAHRSAYRGFRDRVDAMGIRFVPINDGRLEGLGGLDIHATDAARALANAETIGCRTGEDMISICGMRLRLV